jgi:hypothetical protein
MGFFEFLRGLFRSWEDEAALRPRVPMAGPWIDIVGESFYQGNIERLDRGRRAVGQEVAFEALVVPTPSNPHDRNAVAIVVPTIGQVGHLSRQDAAAFRTIALGLLTNGSVGVAQGRLIGEWGSDSKGRIPPGVLIALDVDDPDPERAVVLAKIREQRAAADRVARDPLAVVPGWEARPRLALTRTGGKGRSVPLVGESDHQDILRGVAARMLGAGARSFDALLVAVPSPAGAEHLLVAVVEGRGEIGRLSKSDTERYASVAAAMAAAGVLGACAAVVHEERGGIGVKLEMLGAEQALAAVQATTFAE